MAEPTDKAEKKAQKVAEEAKAELDKGPGDADSGKAKPAEEKSTPPIPAAEDNDGVKPSADPTNEDDLPDVPAAPDKEDEEKQEAKPAEETETPAEPAEAKAEEPDPNKSPEPAVARASVTLVCEVQLASFGDVQGDVRDVFLNHAKTEWKNIIGNVTKEQVKFENC